MATPRALLLLCALLVSRCGVAQAALTSADAAPQFETSSGRKLLTDTRLGAHLHCVGACPSAVLDGPAASQLSMRGGLQKAMEIVHVARRLPDAGWP